MTGLKMLTVVDEDGKNIDRYLEKLSKSFKGTLYLVYVKDVGFYPAEALLEFEKSFNKIKEKGLKVLNRIAKKAEELGFKTEIIGVQYGVAIERILKLEEQLNPDVLIVSHKCGFRRILSEDYIDSIICNARSPVLIAR